MNEEQLTAPWDEVPTEGEATPPVQPEEANVEPVSSGPDSVEDLDKARGSNSGLRESAEPQSQGSYTSDVPPQQNTAPVSPVPPTPPAPISTAPHAVAGPVGPTGMGSPEIMGVSGARATTGPGATGISLSASIATKKPCGNKYVVNAVEGWGKTSTAAFAAPPEDNLIILAPNELGYDVLLNEGLVPAIGRVQIPAPQEGKEEEPWFAFLEFLDSLIHGEKVYKVISFDALGGFEMLCHYAVCRREYDMDWGPRGWANFQEGFRTAVPDWERMLAKIDRIAERGTDILLLGHTVQKMHSNALGPDYERIISNIHWRTWGATKGWCDAVFFAHFAQIVEKVKKGTDKGKGVGTGIRVVQTQQHDAWDAKNRFNMPPTIQAVVPASQMWGYLMQQKGNKKESV